jgi:hypothetical protein
MFRRPGAGEPYRTNKNAALLEAAFLWGVEGVKREILSFAGLAATYSPRA